MSEKETNQATAPNSEERIQGASAIEDAIMKAIDSVEDQKHGDAHKDKLSARTAS